MASGGDPFNQMTHATNRQYNRQNPAFDHRPLDCYHLASNAKWPEAQRWHYTNENDGGGGRYTTPATAFRRARRGGGDDVDRRRSLAPPYDLSLSAELLLSALNDDGAKIKDLVTRGAWTECRTESGATPLICAAAKGSGDAIEALLEAGANPVATDAVGATCLTLAAFHGRLATVTQILDSVESTTAGDDGGGSAMMDGAVEALLEWATHRGETPVMAAAKAGHTQVVVELLRRAKSQWMGTTTTTSGDATAAAATVGYFDGGDTRGLTALSLACRHGHEQVVEALLAGGGRMDERSGKYGMTPLMHAACKGQARVVEFLLKSKKSHHGGAVGKSSRGGGGGHQRTDINDVVDVGDDAEDEAEIGGKQGDEDDESSLSSLCTAKDENGMCALLHAAAGGSVECFKALARAWPGGKDSERVALEETRDAKGRDALMLAARFGGKEMCRYILSGDSTGAAAAAATVGPGGRRPAAGEFDANGESALFAAIKGGHVEVDGAAEMLHRAYPVHEHKLQMLEVKNIEGMTPLLWAAAHGRSDAVRWLVSKGADMLATDRKGRLPRQTADAHGHGETSALLSALARNEWLRL